jgi:hypothetical protein
MKTTSTTENKLKQKIHRQNIVMNKRRERYRHKTLDYRGSGRL